MWTAAIVVATCALISYNGLLILVLAKAPPGRLRRAFVFYLLCMILWALGSLASRLDPAHARNWLNMAVLGGVVGFPFATYAFAREFTQERHGWYRMPLAFCSFLALFVFTHEIGFLDMAYLTPEGFFEVTYRVNALMVLLFLFGGFHFLLSLRDLIVVARRTSQPTQRNRLYYPMMAVALLMLGLLTNLLPALRRLPVDVTANWLSALLLAYAVLRYRLLDMEFVLRLSLSFASVTFTIVICYVVSLALLTQVTPHHRWLVILAISALGAWLLLRYVPGLLISVQMRVDRFLFPQRYDAQALLAELSRANVRLRPMSEVATQVLERLRTAFAMGYGAFFVLTDQGHYQVVAQVGSPPAVDGTVIFQADHPLVMYMAEQQSGLEAQQMPVLSRLKGLWDEERRLLTTMQWAYFLPVIWENRLSGFFALGPKGQGYNYSLADQRLLETMAAQLAIVMANASLYNQALQRRRLAEALARFGVAVNRSLEPRTVLNLVCQESLAAFQADGACIWMREGDALILQASRGIEHQTAAGLRTEVQEGEGLLHQAMVQGQMMGLSEAQLSDWLPEDWVAGFRIRSVAAIPLTGAEGPVGVLMLIDRQNGYRFSPLTHQEEMGLLASQASLAIQNAFLYEASQRHAQALQQAYAELQELDRLKDEFVQNVSHELRTPLTFIKGYVELILEGVLGEGLTGQQKQALQVVLQRTDAVISLVNDILLLQGLERDNFPREPVAMRDVLQRAIDGARVEAERHRLQIRLEVEAGAHLVLGHGGHFGQVFDNLLGNAIKFSPVESCIIVRLRSEGAWVVAEVEDQGIGIPADKLDKIWERFYQVDGSSTRRYGGTGLGLSIVKQIVEGYGGCVQVKSKVGEGSCFTVRLPALSAETQTSPEEGETAA